MPFDDHAGQRALLQEDAPNRCLDDKFRLPRTPLRFGWDSVLGLFPGLGDVLTSAIPLLIVHHAWQTGASKLTPKGPLNCRVLTTSIRRPVQNLARVPGARSVAG